MNAAILYVDDDAPNLDLFRRWFDEQFTVVTAASGAQALEFLEKREIGVVVSDQRMEPMSGIDLLARVEQRWPMVTRMLLTAYSDRDLLLSAIQRGRVHDYVLKPWQPEDLGGRLRYAMDSWQRRALLGPMPDPSPPCRPASSTFDASRGSSRRVLRHDRVGAT